jgi:hypothetical protein
MLVYDRSVRDAVIAGQRRRLADFAPARIEQTLMGALNGVTRRRLPINH